MSLNLDDELFFLIRFLVLSAFAILAFLRLVASFPRSEILLIIGLALSTTCLLSEVSVLETT